MRPLTNQGKFRKRFDFAMCTNRTIFGVETSFYSSGGSKLNGTARSYKQLAEESRQIPGFEFVWFIDGKGWHSAKRNLLETFEAMEHIYSIADLESGICTKLFDLQSGTPGVAVASKRLDAAVAKKFGGELTYLVCICE